MADKITVKSERAAAGYSHSAIPTLTKIHGLIIKGSARMREKMASSFFG